MIHDTYDKQGNAIELSPRNLLKKVLSLYTARGCADRGAGNGVLPDPAQP